MAFLTSAAKRPRGIRGHFAAALLVAAVVAPGAGRAADGFPFDRDLLLDVAPMPSAKRVPMLNVAPDGAAVIDLWCKTVRGFVQLTDRTIRIEADRVPDTLPQYVSAGQCTPERMQADHEVLMLLSQATGWQRRGNSIVLEGPRPLRFRLSDH